MSSNKRNSKNNVPEPQTKATGKNQAQPTATKKPDRFDPVMRLTPEERKLLGGSNSDPWNILLGIATARTTWVGKDWSEEAIRQYYSATVAALRGMAPKNEAESTLAAQFIAGHNAAMECYARAADPGQTFEGQKQYLLLASKLSRTCMICVETSYRSRGLDHRKFTFEYIHGNSPEATARYTTH